MAAPPRSDGQGMHKIASDAGRSEPRTSPGLLLLVLSAVTAIGLLVRLPSFNDSLYADELSTYFIVSGHSLGRVIYLLQGNSVDLSAPLYFVLTSPIQRLGDAAQSLRLISLLAGTAAIPLTYLLGLWTVGRRAGLVGAVLMALNPYLIFYSTEARPYGLMLLLALLSTLTLLRALNTGLIRWWFAYAAFSCAAVYTHYAVIFLLIAQFAWAFWSMPKARRALLVANVAAALGFLPWLPTLLKNAGSPGVEVIGSLHTFGVNAIRTDLGRWAIGHPFVALTSLPGILALAMVAAGVAVGLVGVALPVIRARGRLAVLRPSANKVLILVLALGMPVGLAVYSALGNSLWEPRNLIASSPGLALVIGALITTAGGLLRVAAVGLVVGAFAISGAQMLKSDFQRPDVAGAARFINEVGTSGDPVVEAPFYTPGPLLPLGDVALPEADRSTKENHPALRILYPPLGALLRAPPYASPPSTPAGDVARMAVELARGGRIFLVTPGAGADIGPALGDTPSGRYLVAILGPLGTFLKGLRSQFRLSETRTLPGIVPVSVYVFREGKDPEAPGRRAPMRP